tara:strand:+ start:2926 stop:3318 length:393 start_codon:yes stop_codon:yes gene_type:complete
MSFLKRFRRKKVVEPEVSQEERIFSEHFWDVAEQSYGVIPSTPDVYEDLKKKILPGATGKFTDMGEQGLKDYFTLEIQKKNTQRMEDVMKALNEGGRRRRKSRRKKRRKSRRKSRRKKRRKRTKRRRRRR